MKWLAIALAVLAAFVVALIVGPMLLGDKGYVLISLGNTAVEMTVISFCILVMVPSLPGTYYLDWYCGR